MTHLKHDLSFLLIIVCFAFGLANLAHAQNHPEIYPDYINVTIPPNIAPMNFIVKEPGEVYRVKVSSSAGQPITVMSKTGTIQFPLQEWKQLLSANAGESLRLDISIQSNSQWQDYDSIINPIAEQKIDSHLVYRLLNSAYTRWADMGIYQRNIENFDESPIIHNRATEGKCMNCHSFNQNNPQSMMMHLRGGESSGTLIARDGQMRKVNTATDFNRAGAYPAWHPSGKLIAFSVNQLKMYFHSQEYDPRDVFDRGSDLILYYIDENTVTTSPHISSAERMETFPAWSPDGKILYFVSCPDFQTFIDGDELRYKDILYDLYRISFNAETREWGEAELVLSGKELGKSITFPRISPDGKYLMFCAADDGHFPIYKASADLYLMDLQTNEYEKLALNSDLAETYHTWSSDGRWFVFSSKRMDGITARPFFAYMSPDGEIHKPFVLPQEDPTFYLSYLKTYNRPELITGPVTLRPQQLVKNMYDNDNRFDAQLDANVKAKKEPVGGEQMYNAAPN